ncbi:MAG: NAD(P)/FAD-dependent oxidoreductase [Actinomycetota bacterium]
MDILDCLVVGAGPAGLTAAVYLGRYRRRVAVVDAGRSRAALIPVSHNLAPFPEGIRGPDLLRRMHEAASRYGAPAVPGQVIALARAPEGFRAGLADGAERLARSVLLATGVVDVEPALPGLADAIRDGYVRHCPICDGWEIRGGRIGVIGFGAGGMGEALFLRTWSEDVTLLTLGHPMDLAEAERARLEACGIRVVDTAISSLSLRDGRIEALCAAGGLELRFDTIYSALGTRVRSELAVGLGAGVDATGGIITDGHQRTTIDGVWAAGDVVSGLDQVAVAIGQAAIAATDIHRFLGIPG